MKHLVSFSVTKQLYLLNIDISRTVLLAWRTVNDKMETFAPIFIARCRKIHTRGKVIIIISSRDNYYYLNKVAHIGGMSVKTLIQMKTGSTIIIINNGTGTFQYLYW